MRLMQKLTLACIAGLLAVQLALAQDYPNRPIVLVVPYSTGGGNDAMARIVADGSSPALNDLVGGHVNIYFSSLPPAVGIAGEGKVRALAVTGPQRSHVFPDLPTVAEAGLLGYEAVLHYGIVAPAGTPRPIVDKLNAALREALASEETKAILIGTGADPLSSTPEQYAADIDHEETRWSRIVKAAGVKAN